jgi:hypothetical protein
MADYFTYLSFTIPLRPDQQDWAIKELMRDGDEDDTTGIICGKNGGPADFDLLMTPSGAMEAPPKSGDYIWIMHEDGQGVNVDTMAERLLNIMKHCDVAGAWGFQWSNDCTKPRLDAYGGGACAISQTGIEWMNTADWLIGHGVPRTKARPLKL